MRADPNPFELAGRERKAGSLALLLIGLWSEADPVLRIWKGMDAIIASWPEPLRVQLAERAGVHPPSAKTWARVGQLVQSHIDREYKRLNMDAA